VNDAPSVPSGPSGTSAPRRPGYRENLEALLAAQKPSYGTAAYSRYVNRPLGRRVAALAHRLGVTPNQATVLSACLSGAGIALLALAEPSVPQALGVAVLLASGYVMDSVDGQLARLRGGGSVSGEWLDHTVDTFKTSSLQLAVLVSWYRFPPVEDRAILLIPLLYQVVQMATFFGWMLMPHLRRQHGAGSPPSSQAAREHPLRAWVILPSDYGLMCWLFALLAFPTLFLGAYSAVVAVNTVLLGLALRKWWRELRAMDADSPSARAAR
jgi:phosphatidylglycerophosphate synthase